MMMVEHGAKSLNGEGDTSDDKKWRNEVLLIIGAMSPGYKFTTDDLVFEATTLGVALDDVSAFQVATVISHARKLGMVAYTNTYTRKRINGIPTRKDGASQVYLRTDKSIEDATIPKARLKEAATALAMRLMSTL